jgi:hypothetical protein
MSASCIESCTLEDALGHSMRGEGGNGELIQQHDSMLGRELFELLRQEAAGVSDKRQLPRGAPGATLSVLAISNVSIEVEIGVSERLSICIGKNEMTTPPGPPGKTARRLLLLSLSRLLDMFERPLVLPQMETKNRSEVVATAGPSKAQDVHARTFAKEFGGAKGFAKHRPAALADNSRGLSQGIVKTSSCQPGILRAVVEQIHTKTSACFPVLA